jgi:hypothetical protein
MGTLRVSNRSGQIRKAQSRAKSGMRFAVRSEETVVEISDAGAAGKIQTSAAGAKGKSWVWFEPGDGATGAGCEFDETGAPQHGIPQWQVACAARTTQAACACTGTNGVPASNRLQTMASVIFIVSTMLRLQILRQTFIGFCFSIIGRPLTHQILMFSF